MNTAEYNEQRYYRLINHLTDYIYTVRIRNGKVYDTYHGPGCITVTGYTSEDYRRDPNLWYRMVHNDDREIALEQARRAQNGEDPGTIEHRIIHRDGTVRWVKNAVVLNWNDFGELTSYDGLINDITELKRAEELASVKQKQLIQADKMVSLGILVSGIAHEINNPNNFILLNARLMSQVWEDIQEVLKQYYDEHGEFYIAGMPYSTSNEKISKSIDGIVRGSYRISRITDSLKNFAKADTGDLDQVVDIKQAIETAALIAGNLLKNSTDNFSIELSDNIPPIKGNKQQLEQVMLNLFSNACHSLESKMKKIVVSAEMINDGKNVKICVADEGKGIDEENMKYIFDPFFTTKRDSGGTGLGLSITYNIIKSHGGDLQVNSKAGEGTEITVILPVNGKKKETR